MQVDVTTSVTKAIAKKVACPGCKKTAVIRKTGTYRCSGCNKTFRGVVESAVTTTPPRASSRPPLPIAPGRPPISPSRPSSPSERSRPFSSSERSESRGRSTTLIRNEPPLELDIQILPAARPTRPAARCAKHTDAPAYESCIRCGDFACAQCLVRRGSEVRCTDCAERTQRPTARAGGPETPGSDAGRAPTVGPGVLDILGGTFAGFLGALPRGLVLGLPAAIVTGLAALAVGQGALAPGVLLFLAAPVLHLVAQLGTLRLVRDAIDGTAQPTIGEAFAVGVWPVVRLAWTHLLATVGLGFLALVALGVPMYLGLGMKILVSPVSGFAILAVLLAAVFLVAIRFTLAAPIVAYEEKIGLRALARSWQLVGRRPGATVLVLLAGLAAAFGFGVLNQVVLVFGLPGLLLSVLVNGAASVFGTSLVASLYGGIRGGLDERH